MMRLQERMAQERGRIKEERKNQLVHAKTVTIGRIVEPFTTAMAASKLYRDHIGDRGASQIKHPCYILDDRGKIIAHVSYNGRVWAGKDYVVDAEPIWPG